MRYRPRTRPAATALGARVPVPGLIEIMMQRSWWGACVGHFSGNYLIYFLLTWMPLYLVTERNFSMNKMARVGGVAFLLCALSSLISGPLVDRWIASGTSPTHVHKTMLVIGLTGSGLLLVLCVLATPTLSIVLLMAGSGFYGISNPHIFACAQALAGPRAAGKWMGLQNFVGNFAGIVAPILTGFLVGRTHHFFLPFAVVAIIAIIGSLSWVYVVGPIEPVTWPPADRL
jgi:ACS family D-galactonate transporter-like MFS transporter